MLDKKTQMTDDEISSVFKLLGEPNRLKLMTTLLRQGEHCVSECMCHLPDVSQSLLSHHMADLRNADLVESRKSGLKVYYSLTDRGRTVMSAIENLREKETEMSGCKCQTCVCQNCQC